MDHIGWIIASVGTAVLVGIIVVWRLRRGNRFGVTQQEESTVSHELMTLGSSLVVLGIVFSTDRVIGYSFIGAGVLLSVISVIRSRRNGQRSAVEMR